jgi:hypothetical protein
MTDERESLIGFPEVDEVHWRRYFKEFRDGVFPMFEEQGFTFPEALLAWRLEQVITQMRERSDD